MEFERHSEDCPKFKLIVWHTCKIQGKEVADWTEGAREGYDQNLGFFPCKTLDEFEAFCGNHYT